eukprot:scaffold77574_cov59-Phaeocystis_antarctica.AAC.1
MQHAAFPLQFEFLFDFPGPLGEEELRGAEGANALERLLMTAEMGAARMLASSRGEKPRPSHACTLYGQGTSSMVFPVKKIARRRRRGRAGARGAGRRGAAASPVVPMSAAL